MGDVHDDGPVGARVVVGVVDRQPHLLARRDRLLPVGVRPGEVLDVVLLLWQRDVRNLEHPRMLGPDSAPGSQRLFAGAQCAGRRGLISPLK